MITRTYITVSIFHEGVHCWPGCDIPEVEFLKHPHRHLFHIKCKKIVTLHDREIEIIMFKKSITEYLNKRFGEDFGSMSCEMIATNLVKVFDLNYCEVLEDGENGAEVTKDYQ